MKLTKRIISFALFLSFSLPAGAVWAANVPVYIDNKPTDIVAIAENGESYLKLRDLCNIFYIDLEYDAAVKQIIIKSERESTILKFSGQNIWLETENGRELLSYCMLKDGHVYVPARMAVSSEWNGTGLNIVLRPPHISFDDGVWYVGGEPLAELSGYQQIGDFGYAVISEGGADAVIKIDYLWEFSPAGKRRSLAEYSSIDAYTVTDDAAYILGSDMFLNGCLLKAPLDKTLPLSQLGEADFNYGRNLSYAGVDGLPIIDYQGFVLADDAIYTVGYSRQGFCEGLVMDYDILLDSYGWYRVPLDGSEQQKLTSIPAAILQQ